MSFAQIISGNDDVFVVSSVVVSSVLDDETLDLNVLPS